MFESGQRFRRFHLLAILCDRCIGYISATDHLLSFNNLPGMFSRVSADRATRRRYNDAAGSSENANTILGTGPGLATG